LRAPEESSETLLNVPTLSDALDAIADPDLAHIVREAIWFCWENGRAEYSPTPERRRFMQSYVAGRIPTTRLLDQAWDVCQAEERDVMRASVLGQVTEPDERRAPDLDNLSDEDVDRLFHGTMRKIAVDSRRGIKASQ
jgi:hypothetical protein